MPKCRQVFKREGERGLGDFLIPWVYTQGYKHFVPSGFLHAQIDNLCYGNCPCGDITAPGFTPRATIISSLRDFCTHRLIICATGIVPAGTRDNWSIISI